MYIYKRIICGSRADGKANWFLGQQKVKNNNENIIIPGDAVKVVTSKDDNTSNYTHTSQARTKPAK